MYTTATKVNLPSQLPFLPGNSYADPTITRYHKTQLLGVRDGAMLGKIETNIDRLKEVSNFPLMFRENDHSSRDHRPGTPQINERG